MSVSGPNDPWEPTDRPAGGPDEERPPLIPSRAARHQRQRRRLLRGRPAKPPGQPPAEPPPAAAKAPPKGPTPPGADPGQAPPRPAPRVRPLPDLAARRRREAPAERPARRIPVPRRPAGPPTEAPDQPAPGPGRVRVPGLGSVRSSSVGLAATLVAVAAVLVLAVNALPAAKPPATPATRDPYSARWVCPLLPARTTTVTVANVGTATAALRTTIREAGKGPTPADGKLGGGKTRQLSLDPKKPGFVQVEAFSAPVVVSAPGLGCSPGPASRWWLPASDTRLGTDTKVLIANPDNQPATVDLVPHLTSGSITSDREVFVKPGEAVLQSLGDDAPPGLKPSIEVVARAGRVVVGAVVTGGQGRQPTLLPAQGTPRPAWSFAGGVSGGGRQSQVLVTNPNPNPLQVRVQITTRKGTFTPPGDFDQPIANGGTAELVIPALEVAEPFAVQVRSADGAAFVAALRVSGGDGASATSRIDLGTGQPERGWLVPGLPEGGELVLANLSSVALEARLSDLDARGTDAGKPVPVPPGRIALQKVPDGIENLLVEAGSTGLVAAPLNCGPIVPGSAVGGLPPGGPIVPGPAAAP
jgi:Family of unknown function (DUF5719)